MSMACGSCGAGIASGALSCRRCGAEVPRSQEDRAEIQAERLVSAATDQVKQGSGILGGLLHLSMIVSAIPGLSFIVLFPVGCALLLPDVPGRQHARACCWFCLDMTLLFVALLVVGGLSSLGLIAGAAVTATVHGSGWGDGVSQAAGFSAVTFFIILVVGYLAIAIRWIKHSLVAASAARDGGWHTYPVVFIAPRRTREHG